MFISNLEEKLIYKVSYNIFMKQTDLGLSNSLNYDDYTDLMLSLNKENLYNDKYNFCSTLETIYFSFSVILSEVRAKRREITTGLFESNPKLAQEKSVLKDKLDAEPEYAKIHKLEEQLFQFLEHIQNTKNNVIYLLGNKDE